MPQPNPPQDPHATVKMIPGAMFETNEFSADAIVEQLAARKAEAAKAVSEAVPEAGKDQDGPIQPPPSTSSSR